MQPHDTPPPQFIELGPYTKDITGQRFGRLVALGPIARNKHKRMVWFCQCDCGNTTSTDGNNLRANHIQSCGCLRAEQIGKVNLIHGMAHSHPLYGTWTNIITRCTNTSDRSYALWGARGITMCDEWRHNFMAFCDHVSQLPHYGKKGYSLDRIDNSSGYDPGNVRWATRTEQARNTRTNRLFTFNGETKCLSEWAELTGIKRETIANRLNVGWSVEKALTEPVRRARA